LTLIVSLKGQDGIVLASDSRGTIGDPRGLTAVNDTHKKIFKLSNSCGVATSGASEMCNRLIDSFKKHLEDENLVDVDPIANEFHTWGRQQYRGWFGARQFISSGQTVDQRPNITLIMTGYNDNDINQSRIYLFSSSLDFAPQLCNSGHMLAGVPQYAIYLIHRLYNPNMMLNNIKSLAAYLIQETATQDPKVGGPIKIAEITISSGYNELSDQMVDDIVQGNEQQNASLRNFFFPEEQS